MHGGVGIVVLDPGATMSWREQGTAGAPAIYHRYFVEPLGSPFCRDPGGRRSSIFQTGPKEDVVLYLCISRSRRKNYGPLASHFPVSICVIKWVVQSARRQRTPWEINHGWGSVLARTGNRSCVKILLCRSCVRVKVHFVGEDGNRTANLRAGSFSHNLPCSSHDTSSSIRICVSLLLWLLHSSGALWIGGDSPFSPSIKAFRIASKLCLE